MRIATSMRRAVLLVLLGACATAPAGRETRSVDPGAALTAADSVAIPVNGQVLRTRVPSLEWLAGCWEGRLGSRVIEEHWLAPRHGVLLGLSRTTHGDSVVEHEFMRIFPRDRAIVFAASPSGQAPAEFTAREFGNAEVLFENPAHDFPQRIRYRRVGRDSLVAEIEGGAGDALRRVRFPYARVPCEPVDHVR